MGYYWDEVGLYVMFTGMVVSGLLGGFGVGATMSFAYAADCTDPSKRSTRFSWLHAALFFGLTVGPVMGGALAIATKTIMTIIYIEIVATIVCLAYIAFVVPESLPSRQSPQIRALYEQALQASRSSTDSDKDKKKEDGSWYSHVLRSLQYFKPTGKNTNLILLASMSFMSTLAMKGTLTVMILYTNKVFHWTQKEDGILSSSSSSVRLMTLLVILPILGHYYRKHTEKTLQEGGGNAASVEHLGEAALQLSEDDEDEQEAKERQRRQSAASTRSWETDRTQIPASSSSSPRSPASNSTQKPKKSQESPSSTPIKDGKPARSASQVRADMRFDIWMIRLGFVISCTTYIGYGLATQGWMFYIWSALHAVSIVGVPSLRSLLTNLVEPSEFGAILGAIQVVDSISGIVSPVVVSWVYAATVEDRPEAVWYTIAAATGVCTVLAFMVRQKEFRREVV
ncbi:hypothetical protein CPC16_003170 [Podila verticillata]|nr:hypothetical protein CPC16_003170 [Podila verticillata]